ncbi:MAG: hypothetical protein ACPG7F_12630 [Aggregatilineales bacterium]
MAENTDQQPSQIKQPHPERSRPVAGSTRQLSGTHFIFASIIAIGLALAINFSNRVSADRELNDIQNTIEREIELLENEREELQQRLSYVASDAYVAAWAHEEGRMIREGEVLIIPRPASPVVAVAPPLELMPDVQTTLPEPENPALWWALFFDTSPPGT